jgi:hypothetical protein
MNRAVGGFLEQDGFGLTAQQFGKRRNDQVPRQSGDQLQGSLRQQDSQRDLPTLFSEP